MANTRLNYLEDLDDYKVASKDPDVRGWTIVDRNNTELGKVDHLLADVHERRVRYLDVEPRSELLRDDAAVYGESSQGVHEFRDRKGEVHMIVPIGMARLDTDNNKVVADRLDKETFVGTPLLKKGTPVTLEQEKKVRTYFEDPGAYRDSHNPEMDRRDVTFKSEHHTKGNENIGTRDPVKRRDVSAERTTAGNPEDRTPYEENRETTPHSRTVSDENNEHRIKTTPENSGVPNVDSRGKNVKSSTPDRSETSGENRSAHRDDPNRIHSSGRPMHQEKRNEGRMTPGAPDSLEAGATSAGSQAGSIEPRTTGGRENMRGGNMNVEGDLGKDPQVREAQHRGTEESSRTGSENDSDYRESDEAARRRIESEKDEDFYRHENYDENRFYNRK